MSKIEITLPLTGYAGMKELSLRFHKDEEDFGYNADINVWVKPSDSVSAMQAEATQKARAFLVEMIEAIDAQHLPLQTPAASMRAAHL